MSDTVNIDTNNNKIINAPNLSNTEIVFSGSNNILYFENTELQIVNSSIIFKGNNSTIIIKESKYPLKLNLTIYNNSTIYIGNDCSMNNKLEIIASEAKNVLIGNEGLFSSQCLIRTSDAHRIYSIEDLTRVNEGRSVFIGDHVWLAARVVILKGTMIHSGSIIGSDAVVAGKEIKSNTVWAGNPAKEIKSDVLFDKTGTHGLDNESMREVSTIQMNKAINYIFNYDPKEYIDFKKLDDNLAELKTSQDRLNYVLKIMSVSAKNRFALR